MSKPLHVAAHTEDDGIVIECRPMTRQEIAERQHWLNVAAQRGPLAFVQRRGRTPELRIVGPTRQNSLLVSAVDWQEWQQDYCLLNCWQTVDDAGPSDANVPNIELSCDPGGMVRVGLTATKLPGTVMALLLRFSNLWRKWRRA